MYLERKIYHLGLLHGGVTRGVHIKLIQAGIPADSTE